MAPPLSSSTVAHTSVKPRWAAGHCSALSNASDKPVSVRHPRGWHCHVHITVVDTAVQRSEVTLLGRRSWWTVANRVLSNCKALLLSLLPGVTQSFAFGSSSLGWGSSQSVSPPPRVSSELGMQQENINQMRAHSVYGQWRGVCSLPHPNCLERPQDFMSPEGGGEQGYGLLQPLATGLSKHLYPVGLAKGLLGVEGRV